MNRTTLLERGVRVLSRDAAMVASPNVHMVFKHRGGEPPSAPHSRPTRLTSSLAHPACDTRRTLHPLTSAALKPGV